MVSVGGGTDPAFSPDGNILYYRDTENMLMAVSIRLSESNVEAGTPKPLISVAPPSVGYLRNAYDILPNGNEIIAFVASEREETTIRVRTAWRQW